MILLFPWPQSDKKVSAPRWSEAQSECACKAICIGYEEATYVVESIYVTLLRPTPTIYTTYNRLKKCSQVKSLVKVLRISMNKLAETWKVGEINRELFSTRYIYHFLFHDRIISKV